MLVACSATPARTRFTMSAVARTGRAQRTHVVGGRLRPRAMANPLPLRRAGWWPNDVAVVDLAGAVVPPAEHRWSERSSRAGVSIGTRTIAAGGRPSVGAPSPRGSCTAGPPRRTTYAVDAVNPGGVSDAGVAATAGSAGSAVEVPLLLLGAEHVQDFHVAGVRCGAWEPARFPCPSGWPAAYPLVDPDSATGIAFHGPRSLALVFSSSIGGVVWSGPVRSVAGDRRNRASPKTSVGRKAGSNRVDGLGHYRSPPGHDIRPAADEVPDTP